MNTNRLLYLGPEWSRYGRTSKPAYFPPIASSVNGHYQRKVRVSYLLFFRKPTTFVASHFLEQTLEAMLTAYIALFAVGVIATRHCAPKTNIDHSYKYAATETSGKPGEACFIALTFLEFHARFGNEILGNRVKYTSVPAKCSTKMVKEYQATAACCRYQYPAAAACLQVVSTQ